MSASLDILSDIIAMDKFTTLKVGFAEILKVDECTFTIKSIDEDMYQAYLEEFVGSVQHCNEKGTGSDIEESE